MNYIGSKLSILDFLEHSIEEVAGPERRSFCDIFAGTGTVGARFKQKGYKVVANDIQYYSYVLNRHYIGNHHELSFKGLTAEVRGLEQAAIKDRKDLVCDYLSKQKGEEGFIFKNYCPGGTSDSTQRRYFSDENGKKADAVRRTVEAWLQKDLITEDEYYFLLTSLIESVDKYANTASVYGAFLKRLKKTARMSFTMKPVQLLLNDQNHKVYNEDSNILNRRIESDILYIDPPYNARQYATNYHVLETIAKYDDPALYGKTGLRDYQSQKSLYCSRPRVKEVFDDLISNARAKYIFLSYNDDGLMSKDEIKKIMSKRGEYGYFTKAHNRFRADRSPNRKYKEGGTTEYLHYVVCR